MRSAVYQGSKRSAQGSRSADRHLMAASISLQDQATGGRFRIWRVRGPAAHCPGRSLTVAHTTGDGVRTDLSCFEIAQSRAIYRNNTDVKNRSQNLSDVRELLYQAAVQCDSKHVCSGYFVCSQWHPLV